MKLALRLQSAYGLLFRASLLLIVVLISAAPAQRRAARRSTAPALPARIAALKPIEQRAQARINISTIREVAQTLSSDAMEGRGTASPGGEKAARYIAERFANLGLKPLGDKGSYLQAIEFNVAEVKPETSFKAGDQTLTLRDDYVVVPPYPVTQSNVKGGLVFAGYGIVSTELVRNDFADTDIKGKVALIVDGRSKNVDEAAWKAASNERAVFINLLRRGAAAILMITESSPDKPYSLLAEYLTRRRVQLGSETGMIFDLPPIILMSEAGAEKLFAGSGSSYADTKKRLEAGEFVSRDLNKTVDLSVRVRQEKAIGSNVVGVLYGSDPRLKEEAIIYTAHYDAYGVSADGRIYHGAADNALGVAEIIAIAESFTRTPVRPRRSVIFLAVTGEEYGLLGAEHWVKHPTWPLEKLSANFNFDTLGTEIYGPVQSIVGFGAEHSSLGAMLETIVSTTGGVIIPDPMPDEKVFYRSDHYAFVKRGIPALMLMGAPGGDASQWVTRLRKWLATDYHQPSDVVRPDWNWSGTRTLAQIGLLIGMRVADGDAMPAWLPSSPFNHPRGTNAPPPSDSSGR